MADERQEDNATGDAKFPAAAPRDSSALGGGEPSHPLPNSTLPYSRWWPLAAGAVSGIALRLIYSGNPGGWYAAMMGSFIYLAPVVVGMVTVYVAETSKRRDWGYYLRAPILSNLFFVIGTMLIMIEGLICAVIIIPLFCVLGAIGGLIMGTVCRVTNWPKQTLYGFAALPLVLGALETDVPLPRREAAIERTILISAQPAAIWQQILNARNIKPEEVQHAWLYRIGVPLPMAGITEQTPEGLVRKVTMGKNVHFEQLLTEQTENRYLRWRYRFQQDSFPPYALDEHVVLGGHYFDLTDTSYTLTPRGDLTELKVRMHYRVSTQFNWYADPMAKFLLGNLAEINLDYYRRRSQRNELPR
jgi:hypothetical protein